MKHLLFAGLVFVALGAKAEQLSIEEFESLSVPEQNRILVASYRTATVLLAFGGVGLGEGKLAAEKMASCLKDRNVEWMRNTLFEYVWC